MSCDTQVLRHLPLFALLDDDELAVLATQVELKSFAPRERIYAAGAEAQRAYVVLTGRVKVTVVDEDEQEVVVEEADEGKFFGFASMLEQTPHQTSALAVELTRCIEIDRNDIMTLLRAKPHAGLDIMSVLARQFHNAQQLVRQRSTRNVNELIEERATFGEQVADQVARFGGSWSFIILFLVVLCIYCATNVTLRTSAWDPYPFILLNLFLSMLAAIQAPVIMMSQNRQDTKDRMRGECDYEVNRRAETEIQGLSRKVNQLGDKIDDLEELLRGRTKHDEFSAPQG
jgi:uncharacterized membrane protein